ncbi:MAG: N-6 DNA methylase [Cyclobacteriaceae bacterium]
MSNITSIIRSIRNIMRKDEGLDGDAQRISQMVWMLFMKIFADKEEEWKKSRKTYKSPILEKLKWQNWAADKDGLTGDELITFINDELFPVLKTIEPTDTDQSVIVKSVFNDTYNYMKKGTLFRQVINEINKIDFSNKNLDRHVFNDIYETILKELQSAGSSGEYYTPRAVTQFMVDMINPQIGESISATKKAGVDTLKNTWEGVKNAGSKIGDTIIETGKKANPFHKSTVKWENQ